jgi:myosin heavy subunit
MSTENSELLTPPVNESEGNKNKKWILILLIAALVASWGYMFWDKSQSNKIIADKDAKNVTITSEKDSLQKVFNDVSTKYDGLKVEDASKDSSIVAKDKEITEKQKYIQTILNKTSATKEELTKAKLMIASLNQDVDGYKTQIENLKKANTQLTEEKQQVTNERDIAQKNLDSTKQVVAQKENVIDIGSTLHVSNFSITGIDVKRNGKEKETTKSKKVNLLRIAFTIDENRITQSGSKDLLICITGPDGKLISASEYGSGTFTTRDNVDKGYTQKLAINYVQGKSQIVTFDWKKQSEYPRGDYKIEVYNNGFPIGQSTEHLR